MTQLEPTRTGMLTGLAETQYRHLLRIHEERAQRGEVWLNYGIDSDCVELVVMKMLQLVPDAEQFSRPIRLMINTSGGTTDDGQVIIDTINTLPVPVWTVNVGAAHSMGLSVFLAGSRRFTFPRATFMAHDASYSTVDDKLAEHQAFAKFALKQRKRDAQFYADRSNKTLQFWMKKFTSTDYWFDAEEAVEIGVAHEIVTPSNYNEIFNGVVI